MKKGFHVFDTGIDERILADGFSDYCIRSKIEGDLRR